MLFQLQNKQQERRMLSGEKINISLYNVLCYVMWTKKEMIRMIFMLHFYHILVNGA